jgi:propanol-preferring alcohol dehydrogenase
VAIRGVDSRLSWNFSVEESGRREAEVSEALIIIGADVAAALAASPGAFDQAYRSLRRGGRLVCVALPADNAALSLPISTPS